MNRANFDKRPVAETFAFSKVNVGMARSTHFFSEENNLIEFYSYTLRCQSGEIEI